MNILIGSYKKNSHIIPDFYSKTTVASTPCNDYSGISGNTIDFNNKNEWYYRKWDSISEKEKSIIGDMWVYLANEFYYLSSFIKNPDFKKEKEYRFAFMRNQGVYSYTTPNSSFCIEVKINPDCIIHNEYIGKGTNVNM